MAPFSNLFGIKESTIKKTCIITPFLSKGLLKTLGIAELAKGKPFSAGQGEHFTFFHSQIGASYVGDAVLYLENTQCENLIFLGACGLVQTSSRLQLGSIVTPFQCLALESFSKLLSKDFNNPDILTANEVLLNQFLQCHQDENVVQVTCATLGSIKLEYEYLDFLKQKDVDVVDMECSAFISAADSIKRKSLALLYVTDIVGINHVFAPKAYPDQRLIYNAQKRTAQMLTSFASRLK